MLVMDFSHRNFVLRICKTERNGTERNEKKRNEETKRNRENKANFGYFEKFEISEISKFFIMIWRAMRFRTIERLVEQNRKSPNLE